MIAAATDDGVCLLEFADRRMLPTQIARLQKLLNAKFAPGRNPHLVRLETELERYFAGALREFTVPLVVPGTEFQRAVWEALQRVPCGETSSYEWLAREVGRPSAVRAVGHANGDNRIGIVIPCHRIVGKDGRLVGYGGGLWRKEALLKLERSDVRPGPARH
jgi:AraC family transcriptional regulator of adaptative response/methylated-DNA-[protein]-cysteine methyltransferase